MEIPAAQVSTASELYLGFLIEQVFDAGLSSRYRIAVKKFSDTLDKMYRKYDSI